MNKRYCSVNNWLIDVNSGSILSLTSGERKRLGEYQLKLLETLSENAGQILTREELTTLVWENRVIGNNSLPNAIHALRAALEDDGKKQRVIRTIPRKGYLLEAEYCRVIEKDEEEVRDISADDLVSDAVIYGEYPVQDSQAAFPAESGQMAPTQHALPATRFPRQTRWWENLLCMALVVVVSAALTSFVVWRYFETISNKLTYREQESNVYSNIHLYEVISSGVADSNSKDPLYNKLKETFYRMNQLLKEQSITMNVYYQNSGPTLNYTFSLKSPCDRKQLAMSIYHWRVDPSKLNNLILSEARRKIGEMENCSRG